MDVVTVIVQQLAEVSQHTASASNAMRHLVAEIAQLRKLRSMDATKVAKALAAAGSRSGSPGAVDNCSDRSRTTDPALRKVQEKDPEFQKYNGKPEHFLPWRVAVEDRKELTQLSDQAAIIFATEALEGYERGTAGDGNKFKDRREFERELKSKFCPQTVEYNVSHTLQHMKVLSF